MDTKDMLIISKADSDILTSAKLLATGILANPNLFPAPPCQGKDLLKECDECQKNAENEMTAKAFYEAALKKKKDSFAHLRTLYAEDRAYCKAKAKESKVPSSYTAAGLPIPKGKVIPQVPGMCLGFSVISQGIGSAVFKVKKPLNRSGGKTKYIEIHFKETDSKDDVWGIAAVTMSSRVQISNMPIGKLISFRAVAVNMVGAGKPGNVVDIKF